MLAWLMDMGFAGGTASVAPTTNANLMFLLGVGHLMRALAIVSVLMVLGR